MGKIALTLVSTLTMACFLSGCRQDSPAPAETPQTAGTFTGQELPEKVEELEGTPLYSGSEEIHSLLALDGASYLLIAPQDPLKAVLVLEPGAVPAELAKRESKPVKLSGKKEVADSKALVDLVKQRYELDLQTDTEGRVVVLRVESAGTVPVQDASTPQGE